MVKSTQTGDISAFNKQDCLYTIHTRGIVDQVIIDEKQLITIIQSVVDANTSWDWVLAKAKIPHINILISNTTEKGISYTEEDINDKVPATSPRKNNLLLISPLSTPWRYLFKWYFILKIVIF